MVSVNKMLVTVLLLACISLQASAQEYCYQQVCRECDAKSEEVQGESVKCDMNNQVTLSWLGSTVTSYNSVNITNTTLGHSCIKLVAAKTNTDDNGDSTDVIKGCVVSSMAEATCNTLLQLEKDRMKEGNCFICNESECNSSITRTGSILMLIITSVLARIFNY